MSCNFSGILPAADSRRFAVGQLVATPKWLRGPNRDDLIGWQAEVVVGTVVAVEDEYDPAPDAEWPYWQELVIEVTVAGKTSLYNRSNFNTIPLPKAA